MDIDKKHIIIIEGKECVAMRHVKKLTGYGSSNIYHLVNRGVINRIKRGGTHLYELASIRGYIGNDDANKAGNIQ
jgi:predicted transcriptional regulator of viral defense system